MTKSAKELQRQIEIERVEIARRNDFSMHLRKLKIQQENRLKKIAQRVANPGSILEVDDFVRDFCYEVFSFGEQLGVMTESEIRLMRAICNFENFESLSREKRIKILEIAARILEK
jgi:hypothetical protein